MYIAHQNGSYKVVTNSKVLLKDIPSQLKKGVSVKASESLDLDFELNPELIDAESSIGWSSPPEVCGEKVSIYHQLKLEAKIKGEKVSTVIALSPVYFTHKSIVVQSQVREAAPEPVSCNAFAVARVSDLKICLPFLAPDAILLKPTHPYNDETLAKQHVSKGEGYMCAGTLKHGEFAKLTPAAVQPLNDPAQQDLKSVEYKPFPLPKASEFTS